MKLNKELKKLELQNDEIQKQINKIREVEDKKRQEEMKSLIGYCLKGNYGNYCYRKILEFVETKSGVYFIFEEIKINNGGEASIRTTSDYPYTNKEWYCEEIPISGWTKKITEKEYQNAKNKVINEMEAKTELRKFLLTP